MAAIQFVKDKNQPCEPRLRPKAAPVFLTKESAWWEYQAWLVEEEESGRTA